MPSLSSIFSLLLSMRDILITGFLLFLLIIVFIIRMKVKGGEGAGKPAKTSGKGDLYAIIIDSGTKTYNVVPCDMLSPNVYLGFVNDEPVYVFIPSDEYKYKDQKGKLTVFCEKIGGITRPLNPELEATLTAMRDTKDLKEIEASDLASLIYELSKMEMRKKGVIPIGTRINLAITFKPANILNQILETIITDSVKTFDVITATATSIEKMSKLYQERARLMRERARMFGIIPMIIISIALVIVMYLLFAR